MPSCSIRPFSSPFWMVRFGADTLPGIVVIDEDPGSTDIVVVVVTLAIYVLKTTATPTAATAAATLAVAYFSIVGSSANVIFLGNYTA